MRHVEVTVTCEVDDDMAGLTELDFVAALTRACDMQAPYVGIADMEIEGTLSGVRFVD